uniref:Uncharacterized protein n=1 Tax=viral metagenome TaxID=1070528 RepID=A0A6C0DNN4_9ZZZZ
MRDAPVPVVAYVMVGLTSAVLAYVTYSDNSVPGQEKIQENNSVESNTIAKTGILTSAAAMLPALPAFFSGKKEEPPLAEAKMIEENEQINENEKQPQEDQEQQQEQREQREQREQQPVENEIKQTGGKKSKKNKTKNHQRVCKKNKKNKTKCRK